MHCRKSVCLRSSLQVRVVCGKHLRLITSSGLPRSVYSQLQQALAKGQTSWAAATRGTEASTPPTRAAPINLSALPRERLPLRSEEHTSELQSRQYLVCR